MNNTNKTTDRNPERVLPDYDGGGLLNLVASCVASRGGAPLHPLLRDLPGVELAGARNVLLFLVDGLGYNYLSTHGAGSAMASHLVGRMTSVFPSTTASAITTTFTGLAPGEHGLTGWFTWFDEAGTIAAALPFKPRVPGETLEARGIGPQHLYRGAPMFDSLADEAFVVSYRPIIDSTYNRHFCGRAARLAYDTLDGLVNQAETAVKSGPRRKFVYAYYPEFDTASHRFGVASTQTAAVFAAIDAAFAELLRRLAGTDTTVIVSADHGFIDCPEENALDLAQCPEVAGLLARPLTGERRVAFCHVLPGRQDEFAARAGEWLAGKADVVPAQVPLDEGWFGRGDLHPRLAGRIGDFVLMMRDTYTIKDWLPGEPRHLHIGNHGGMAADEMYIPLVVASR
ncbi:MAG: alkaline phosphatase family protein [Betaproteobacteria bacterium]